MKPEEWDMPKALFHRAKNVGENVSAEMELFQVYKLASCLLCCLLGSSWCLGDVIMPPKTPLRPRSSPHNKYGVSWNGFSSVCEWLRNHFDLAVVLLHQLLFGILKRSSCEKNRNYQVSHPFKVWRVRGLERYACLWALTCAVLRQQQLSAQPPRLLAEA